MKYLLLVYEDDDQPLESPSPGDQDKAVNARIAYEEILRESGYLLTAVQFQNMTAMTIQVLNGELAITEGFTRYQMEVQLVALYFISARDLNEAIRVTSKMPQVHKGPIVLKPVMDSDWLPTFHLKDK